MSEQFYHDEQCASLTLSTAPCNCKLAEIQRLREQLAERERELASPIPMILFCPACGLQHIDAPDERTLDWTNPPHKSHLCHGCKHIWRPCDRPTNGVAEITTQGKADSPAVRKTSSLLKMIQELDEAFADERAELKLALDRIHALEEALRSHGVIVMNNSELCTFCGSSAPVLLKQIVHRDNCELQRLLTPISEPPVQAAEPEVTKLWIERAKRVGCPCDEPDGFKCNYANPAQANNWPCACVCHQTFTKPVPPEGSTEESK